MSCRKATGRLMGEKRKKRNLIGCYCRVSSHTQKTASQHAEIKRWLEANGIEASNVRWFEDQETGRKLQRPAFAELQKAVFDGTVRTVVVWKLDRLSRSQRDGLNLIADWCDRGVRIVSVTQQVDLSGVVGRMVASVLFGIAEIELEHRRERQTAGIELAKKAGVYRGRLKGTTKARPTRALELRTRGLTVPEIANALEISERTVFRYLRDSSVSQIKET